MRSTDGLIPVAAVALLVLARVAGLAWTAPGWSVPALGWRLRLALAVSLAAIVGPVVAPGISAATDPAGLARQAVAELAVGLGLGLSLGLVLAAARQAGELVGLQAGLSPASLLDPEAADGGESTPMGHLYALVALSAFLAIEGPLQVVDAVIGSYTTMPAGSVALDATTVGQAFARLGEATGLVLQAAAPITVALLAAGIAVGLVSRAAGGLALFSVSLPVRWLLGMAMALAGLGAAAAVFSEAWTRFLGGG